MFFGLLFIALIVLILYFGSERRSRANVDPITNLSNQMDRTATAAQLETLAELPAYTSERATHLAIAAGIRSGRTPLPINTSIEAEPVMVAARVTSPPIRNIDIINLIC